jgi:hypothetical protein
VSNIIRRYTVLPNMLGISLCLCANNPAMAFDLGGLVKQVQQAAQQQETQGQPPVQPSASKATNEQPATAPVIVENKSVAASQADSKALPISTLPKDFHGWWAVNCKAAKEAAKRDVFEGYQIDGGHINQHEDGCDIKKMAQSPSASGGGRVVANLGCEVEGTPYEKTVILELNPTGKLSVSFPNDEPSKPEVLSRCGK